MKELLYKTRELNKILQRSSSESVIFTDICKTLVDIMNCNIYILDPSGNILGYNFINNFECEIINKEVLHEMKFSDEYNQKILTIMDIKSDIITNGKCILSSSIDCTHSDKITTVVPIIGNRERLGTLLITRYSKEFTDDDLVLAEYSAAIVGMEIIRLKQVEKEEEIREKAVVQLAIATLSYSEFEAVDSVFNELDGEEGLIISSKVADKFGITRSVIVNALRKLESSGVITSRSLGMKGTYIKILNKKLKDELIRVKG